MVRLTRPQGRTVWAAATSLIVLAGLVSSARADMEIYDFQANRHTRFYTDPDRDFVGDPYDWSSVGQSSSGTPYWSTLISDRYFLSSNHFHTGAPNPVTFWDATVGGTAYGYTVYNGWQIMTGDGKPTDIWLGKLNTVADAGIARAPLLLLPTLDDYLDLPLFNYGRLNRVGSNTLDGFALVDVDVPSDDIGDVVGMTFDYDYGDAEPTIETDETWLQSGDSGGPSFALYNGQMGLVGIHWSSYNASPPDFPSPFSLDSFIPYYIPQIRAQMDATGGAGEELTYVIIPEPATMLLLGIGSIVVLRRRKWRA